jgi:SAM-dependent methyltransferase
MNRKYWQAVASDWEKQVFDTLHEDSGKVIRSAVLGLAPTSATIMDFGCGVGRYLPFLAQNFKNVVGVDWSSECIKRAQLVSRKFANVKAMTASPAVLRTLRSSCDTTLAVNVFIHPDRKKRESALKSAIALTRPGGWLVIVVPSLESVIYAESVRRVFRPRAESEFGFVEARKFNDPGVVCLGDEPTKHFVQEELQVLLRSLGCIPKEGRRVQYSWRIYESGIPPRFKAPLPWDWLMLAQRK